MSRRDEDGDLQGTEPANGPSGIPTRPAIGSKVCLLRWDAYLSAYHGAGAGSIGTVVLYSRLGPDDDGVLIDWGDGQAVRSNLDEFALVATTEGVFPMTDTPKTAEEIISEWMESDGDVVALVESARAAGKAEAAREALTLAAGWFDDDETDWNEKDIRQVLLTRARHPEQHTNKEAEAKYRRVHDYAAALQIRSDAYQKGLADALNAIEDERGEEVYTILKAAYDTGIEKSHEQ